LVIDQAQARKQLELLGYDKDETIFYRLLPAKYLPYKVAPSNHQGNIESLPHTQQRDKAIYVVVNGQGHKAEDISHGRALMFESDDSSLTRKQHLNIWQKLGLEPTLQVSTRHSIHNYFVFDQPVPIEQWKELQEDCNEYLNTDPSIKDAPRLMRIAGAWHTQWDKDTQTEMEPVQCQLINVTGKKYSFAQLRELIPVRAKKTKPKVKPPQPVAPVSLSFGFDGDRRISDYVDQAKKQLGSSPFEFMRVDDHGRCNCCFHDSTSGNSAWIREYPDGSGYHFNCPTCTPDGKGINSFKFWLWQKYGPGTPIPNGKDYVENAKEFCRLAGIEIPDNTANKASTMQNTSNKQSNVDDQEVDFELEANRFRLELQSLSQEHDPIKRTLKISRLIKERQLSRRDIESMLASVSNDSTRPKAVRHKIGDFIQLESGSTSTQLVPGMIGKGVNLIAGEGGAGKTTFAYDVAASVVTGEPFLGETPTQTGKVLIISSDEGRSYAQDKLINRGLGSFTDEIEIIEFWDVSQMQLLEDAISETRPVLVIVDSFNAIHSDPNFDENSAQASQSIKFLERLGSIYNTTIILTHHLNKCKDQKGLGRLRGSTAIAASCSVALILENADRGDVADTRKRLYSPKMRGGEPIDLLLTMNPHEGRFTLVNPSPGEETKPLCDQLMMFFERNAGTLFEVGELESAGITANNRKHYYTALDRMVKRGQIVKRPSKINPRSKVYGISCTENENSLHPAETPPPTSCLHDNTPQAETLDIKGFEDSLHPSLHPVYTQSTGQKVVQAQPLTQQGNGDSLHPGELYEGGGSVEGVDSNTVLATKDIGEPHTTKKREAIAGLMRNWDQSRQAIHLRLHAGFSRFDFDASIDENLSRCQSLDRLYSYLQGRGLIC
jgi:hypothetical protein